MDILPQTISPQPFSGLLISAKENIFPSAIMTTEFRVAFFNHRENSVIRYTQWGELSGRIFLGKCRPLGPVMWNEAALWATTIEGKRRCCNTLLGMRRTNVPASACWWLRHALRHSRVRKAFGCSHALIHRISSPTTMASMFHLILRFRFYSGTIDLSVNRIICMAIKVIA